PIARTRLHPRCCGGLPCGSWRGIPTRRSPGRSTPRSGPSSGSWSGSGRGGRPAGGVPTAIAGVPAGPPGRGGRRIPASPRALRASPRAVEAAEGIMSAVPPGERSWIDEQADRFERAWRAGQQPRIEDYLAGVEEPRRSRLLEELLRVEHELRRGGEAPADPEE